MHVLRVQPVTKGFVTDKKIHFHNFNLFCIIIMVIVIIITIIIIIITNTIIYY